MSDALVGAVVEGRFIQHLDDIYAMTANDQDVVIVITGAERSGKSGLADVAAEYWDPDFDPELQCHWSTRSYAAACEVLKPRKPIVHDELVRSGSSYSFMSPETKDFADLLTVNGYRNLIQLLLMPNKRWISPIIKEHRAWFRWHIVKRFRDHVVLKVYQLRDQEGVFERERLLFTATSPKPEGPKWKRILELKDEFARNVGRGTADIHELFKAERSRMARSLRQLFARKAQRAPGAA